MEISVGEECWRRVLNPAAPDSLPVTMQQYEGALLRPTKLAKHIKHVEPIEPIEPIKPIKLVKPIAVAANDVSAGIAILKVCYNICILGAAPCSHVASSYALAK